MLVLGIETSCDDTGLALYDAASHQVVAEKIHSQFQTHALYGGVVPELASRDHAERLLPLCQQVFQEAGVKLQAVDLIAYTRGPGLIGSLMVGASFAKALAFALGKPAVGVHHLEAHILSVFLEECVPQYPFLALLVSGGHTQLLSVTAWGVYRLLGESVDDAVGEAFDKTARLLGLPLPGGPHIEQLALKGDPQRFYLTRPMAHSGDLNWSFSGLKTQVRHYYDQYGMEAAADIARAFEEAAIDSLLVKIKKALTATRCRQLVVVGGVSANQRLRAQLSQLERVEVFLPSLAHATDNGAMVAFTGYARFIQGCYDKEHTIQVKPQWKIAEISEAFGYPIPLD